MDKQTKKGVLILIAVIVPVFVLSFLHIWYQQNHKFRYEDHLADTVMKVDEKEISLTELGYYIYTVEKFVDQQARLYNPENPYDYWNTHFSAGLNSKFVSDMAEDKVYSTCICDYIYEAMALEAGYELTEEEEKEAELKAEELLDEMKPEQREKTGLTLEILQDIEKRKQLVTKYARDYIDTIDFTGYSGRPEELISAGGDYYETEIVPEHTIWYNNKLKAEINVGTITLDNP